MAALDLTNAVWQTSSRSGTNGNCVQVAINLLGTHGAVYVRDSKNPDAGVLAFTKAEWEAFTGGVNDGEFDL